MSILFQLMNLFIFLNSMTFLHSTQHNAHVFHLSTKSFIKKKLTTNFVIYLLLEEIRVQNQPYSLMLFTHNNQFFFLLRTNQTHVWPPTIYKTDYRIKYGHTFNIIIIDHKIFKYIKLMDRQWTFYCYEICIVIFNDFFCCKW